MDKFPHKIGDLVRVSDEWLEREESFLKMINSRQRPRLPSAEDIGIILFFHEMPEEPYDEPDFPYDAAGAEIHWFRENILPLNGRYGWDQDLLSTVLKSQRS